MAQSASSRQSLPKWPEFSTADGRPRLMLVGHRGAGMNREPRPNEAGALSCGRFRENTIKSFNRAAELGADFVEFDVQVTRDGCPVVFHDNRLLTADGAEACIPDLTLAEFRGVGPAKGSLETTRYLMRKPRNVAPYKWTVDEEDYLPTLEEVFADVHPSLGFNIEIKFPGDDPSEFDADAETERILAAVLPVVLRCRGPRHVFFSSFLPQAVIALRQQQAEHHVLFLTVGHARYNFSDSRMNSVAAAVELCKDHGLTGVVSEASALVDGSGGAEAVKREGLVLLSYGAANDDFDAVCCQQYRGVNGVIVDEVEMIVGKAKEADITKLGPPFGKFCQEA